MEVSRPTLERIYTNIVECSQYKLPWPIGPHAKDKLKVTRRRAGEKTEYPSGKLTRAAWDVAAILAPLVPPPPAFKKVAPITVTKQGGSDQRVCLFNPDGSMRPGVSRLPNGEYTDESSAKYNSDGDGLENSSVRTQLAEGAFGLTKAKEMDGRTACQCHTAGEPTQNTGSWTV